MTDAPDEMYACGLGLGNEAVRAALLARSGDPRSLDALNERIAGLGVHPDAITSGLLTCLATVCAELVVYLTRTTSAYAKRMGEALEPEPDDTDYDPLVWWDDFSMRWSAENPNAWIGGIEGWLKGGADQG